MAKTDFTFVGAPHDPYSISGSDPHTGSVRKSPLAIWYKIEPGFFLTSSQVYNDGQGPGHNYIWRLYDSSGNSRHRGVSGPTTRHLAAASSTQDGDFHYTPVISASMVGGDYIGGDNQFFLMGDPQYNNGRVLMMNRFLRDDYDVDADNADNLNWQSKWVSGSDSETGSGIANGAWSGYTHFSVMKHHTDYNTTAYPFSCVYGYARNDTSVGGNKHSTFGMGIRKNGSGTGNLQHLVMYWNDNADNGAVEMKSSDANYGPGFHVVSGRMQRGDGDPATTTGRMELFANGELVNTNNLLGNNASAPVSTGQTKTCYIGGSDGQGSGYIQTPTGTGTGASSLFSGLAEWFVFESALSDVRRQQMERYLADKTGQEMSASAYLSQMEGGPSGTAVNHASLSSPLSGNGTYARAYYQAATSSAEPKIQHETCGGGFIRSTADSGKFYNVTASSAISMRMHVRAEALNDSNHSGSHVALVSKATSPFGNQIDNIKGYALKFGTLHNGHDSGDTPKFRLSLRNSDQWTDGTTANSCTDIVMSSSILGENLSVDTWYTMRLDVIPSGKQFDRVKAYASTDGGTTFHELSASGTSTVAQDIVRDSERYRYWKDDGNFNSKRVPIQNGTHNGYYVAMSSSTGNTLTTKYYIDGFTAKLDKVT